MGEGGERYAEFAPPAALRPWVRTIWTYASASPSAAPQRIAPDGCPELILDIASPYEEQGADGVFRLQPSRIFAGQMTRPLAIRPAGPVELVAIRFEPDGARDWLGRPLVEATDRRLDVGARLGGLVAPAGDPERQARVMAEWLDRERAAGDWTIDAATRAEIEDMERGESRRRGPSERRALQRLFLDRVGIPPRTLRSIVRFRRVFDHLGEDPERTGWLAAGLDAGYFDQPQLARDFRRFLGCTASEWAREQVELARRIASHSYNRNPLSPH